MPLLPAQASLRSRVTSLRGQRGALMVLVLVILLVVSMLGLSTMDATGLEMQMASNSREQQQIFEAAEYTLSWVENQIQTAGFSDASLVNNTGVCGNVCFDATCSNGYCFNNFGDPTNVPTDPANCQLGAPAAEIYESADVWDDDPGDGSHSQLLLVPPTNIAARYIVEFRCYAAGDPTQPFLDPPDNFVPVYRITAFVEGESGRTRVMLRSTMKDF